MKYLSLAIFSLVFSINLFAGWQEDAIAAGVPENDLGEFAHGVALTMMYNNGAELNEEQREAHYQFLSKFSVDATILAHQMARGIRLENWDAIRERLLSQRISPDSGSATLRVLDRTLMELGVTLSRMILGSYGRHRADIIAD